MHQSHRSLLHVILVPLLFLIILLHGCKNQTTDVQISPRSARLGFTNFPYERSVPAVQFVLDVIKRDGDMIVSHSDNGVPWDASLANDFSQYPQDFRDEIAAINANKPAGHALYVATTPIAFLRNRLAPTRGANGQATFQVPWSTYPFDHADVIKAFTNHCRILIRNLNPDYFAFGIEVNLLRELGGDTLWNQHLVLAHAVYDSLKVSSPQLPVFQTIQVESYYRNSVLGSTLVTQVMPITDILALSTYPYAESSLYPDQSLADPARLTSTYLAGFANLAQGKPVAISETGWPAENVTAPYPITIRSTLGEQRAYVDFVVDAIGKTNAKFVCWFLARDYDQLWTSELKSDPNASLLRIWKDIGLYDSTGTPRPALTSWRNALAHPLQ